MSDKSKDDVPVADVQTTLGVLRKQVEHEMSEKHRKDIEQAVDEALVRYHGRQREGGADYTGGSFELDSRFAAYAHTGVLSESWMPIMVKAGKGERITEDKVKEAVDGFISGFPIVESNGLISSNMATSQERLFKAMKSSDQKSSIDPHATSIITILTNYIFGDKLLVGCSHNQKVDLLLRDFWKRNSMNKRIKNAIKRKIITGEHYFFYFIDDNGDVIIRDSVRPWEIQQIETHEEDLETILSYGRAKNNDRIVDQYDYYADVNYFEQLEKAWGQTSAHAATLTPDRLVQMVKYGGSATLRGVTPLYPVLRYLKYYEDFIVDRIILNHERSKVVWVKVLKGSGSEESSRTSIGPKSGQVLIQTPWLEWKAINANINSADASEDGRIIRLTISAGVHLSEHLLFHDASQAVYASLKNQDTPHAQNIRSQQSDWTWDLEKMARCLIREKVKRGKIPPTTRQEIVTLESWQKMYFEIKDMISENVHASTIRNELKKLMDDTARKTRVINTEDVEVDINFPDPVQEDPLKQAQRAEVLHRIHVASLPEIASWVGLNWWEQNDLQNKAGGWPEISSPSAKATDTKPGELTTTNPDE